jgi:hypothetical protein
MIDDAKLLESCMTRRLPISNFFVFSSKLTIVTMKGISRVRSSLFIVELRPIVIRQELDDGTKKVEY